MTEKDGVWGALKKKKISAFPFSRGGTYIIGQFSIPATARQVSECSEKGRRQRAEGGVCSFAVSHSKLGRVVYRQHFLLVRSRARQPCHAVGTLACCRRVGNVVLQHCCYCVLCLLVVFRRQQQQQHSRPEIKAVPWKRQQQQLQQQQRQQQRRRSVLMTSEWAQLLHYMIAVFYVRALYVRFLDGVTAVVVTDSSLERTSFHIRSL